MTATMTRPERLAAMQSILDAAERSGRNLTRDESNRFDALMAAERIAGLDTVTRAQPGLTALERFSGRPQPAPVNPLRLRPSDRLVDHVHFDSDVRPEQMNMTRYVRGLTTGQWDKNSHEYKAAMSSPSGPAGGYLIGSELSSLVLDRMRDSSVLVQAGMITSPMSSPKVTIAKVTGDPSGRWHAEGNDDLTDSGMTLGAISLESKTLACLTKVSIELLEDAENIDDVVLRSVAASMALEVDRAGLFGQLTSGPLEPLGVTLWSGVVTTTINSNFTPDVAIQMMGRMWAQNHAPNALLWSPTTRSGFAQLIDGNGGYLSNNLPPELRDLPRFSTTQIPSTTAIMLDATKVIFGVRTQLQTEISRVSSDTTNSAFTSLQAWIRCYLRCDIALEYAEAVQVVNGLT